MYDLKTELMYHNYTYQWAVRLMFGKIYAQIMPNDKLKTKNRLIKLALPIHDACLNNYT